jgi:cell division protein FtsX
MASFIERSAHSSELQRQLKDKTSSAQIGERPKTRKYKITITKHSQQNTRSSQRMILYENILYVSKVTEI